MIKNCINTFFSSVFRVLGRICAYLIVGIVFYVLAGYLGLLRVNAATISYSSSRWAFGYHTFSSSSDNYYDFSWEALLPIPNPTDRFFVPPTNSGVSSYNSFPITAFRFDIVDVNLKPDTWYEITVNFGFSNNYTGIFWENATVNSCYVSNVACSNASVRKINNSQIKFTFKPTSSGDYLYIDVGKTSDGKNIPELLTNFAEPSLAEYQYFYVSSLTIEPISDVSGELSDLNNTQKETNNKIDETNKNLEEIDETLKNEDISDIDFSLSGIVQSSDSPVSDMVLLPITLLNKLNDSTSSACSSWFMPFDFTGGNNVLELPCIDLKNYLGTNLVNIIDDLICIFMTYSIIMSFISFFDDITSLRDTYNSMYEPKHAYTGYKPKHGKE